MSVGKPTTMSRFLRITASGNSEPVLEHPAGQVARELVLHERRKPCARVVTAAGFGQKVLDVVSYHPVKRCSLGVAATVLRRKWTARSTRRALEGQWRAQGRRIAHDFGGYGWGGIHPPGYRLRATDVSSGLSNCPHRTNLREASCWRRRYPKRGCRTGS